jgi:predicted alpha/beta superfamily hydrolase
VAVTEPELFDSYILTSPSLWYDHHRMSKAEAAYAASHKDLKARIYLATGELERPRPGGDAEDMVADQQAFAKALRSRGYPSLEVRDEIMDGTVHETTFQLAWCMACSGCSRNTERHNRSVQDFPLGTVAFEAQFP